MNNPIWTDKDLGVVSAFGVAKENGWTGTEAEWEALQAAAPQKASDAEAYAAGTRSGTEVESDDPAYHNNAAYYAGQAKVSETEAAGSATSAAASAEDALQHTQSVIETWLENNIDPDSGYALDRTLALPSAAAPANLVGDLKSTTDNLFSSADKSYGNYLTPTTTTGKYINGSGTIAETSAGNIDKYAVEKGKIYRCIAPKFSAAGAYTGIAFSSSGSVTTGDTVDMIVLKVTSTGTSYDIVFPAYADGYLLVSRFNGRGKVYICPISSETIIDSEFAKELDKSIKSEYKIQTGITTNDYYLNADGDVTAYTGYNITAYKIYRGKKYKFTANGYYLASAYTAIGFSKAGVIEAGYRCEAIIKRASTSSENINIEYTATEDGYILTTDYGRRIINVYSYDFADVAMVSSLPPLEKLLSASGSYTSRYMDSSGQVKTYSAGTIKVYPVSKGKKYTCVSLKVSSGSAAYIMIGFDTTNSPDVNDYCKMPLHTATTTNSYDKYEYTPEENGYLWVVQFAGRGAYTVYEENMIDCIDVNATLPLYGDVVAILGDSIMQNMRTNEVGSNVQTYVYNGTAYPYSELDNVNGHLYKDGNECTVTNSAQEGLDQQNWDALKNLVGATKVINASIGGSMLNETDVITPYPGNESDTNYTLCLPNLVRWLKRLTDNGDPIPNCIIIWMGTNNIAGNDGDFDTIMDVPWETLSDDANGREYRRTTYGGLRYALEMLYRNYSDATIFVLGPIQSANPTRTIERIETRNAVMQKMAERYSCTFINAMHSIGIVDKYEVNGGAGKWLRDGLHPDVEGMRLYANYLARRLNSLYYNKTKLI